MHMNRNGGLVNVYKTEELFVKASKQFYVLSTVLLTEEPASSKLMLWWCHFLSLLKLFSMASSRSYIWLYCTSLVPVSVDYWLWYNLKRRRGRKVANKLPLKSSVWLLMSFFSCYSFATGTSQKSRSIFPSTMGNVGAWL